jgi:hypothetical protein
MSDWSWSFEWENAQALQDRIREYVNTHFRSIKEDDGGKDALEQAVEWTRETMEREGCTPAVIKEQCEHLAVSMLQFELFNKFIGDVRMGEDDE